MQVKNPDEVTAAFEKLTRRHKYNIMDFAQMAKRHYKAKEYGTAAHFKGVVVGYLIALNEVGVLSSQDGYALEDYYEEMIKER